MTFAKKISLLAIGALFCASCVQAAESGIGQKLAGRILLQVQSNGEAWYLHPDEAQKYYLGRPADAYKLMRQKGIGITRADLAKIPVGLLNPGCDAQKQKTGNDADRDGLSDPMEEAINTDMNAADTDQDGHNDCEELVAGYDPLGAGRQAYEKDFATRHAGKIFLQTKNQGEAWYVNPKDNKRYFLSRPSQAFALMRKLGLGVTDNNLARIPTAPGYGIRNKTEEQSKTEEEEEEGCSSCQTAEQAMLGAGQAARDNDAPEFASYFAPELKDSLEYSLKHLDSDAKLLLGNILSGATKKTSSDNKVVFAKDMHFRDWTKEATFTVKKQANGQWLIMNL